MFNESAVYRHSGRLGSGAVLVPVIGVLSSVVLSIAYAYADVYIPIAGWVSFILTGGFAVAVGTVVARAAVAGNCRNAAYVRFMGFLISLAALYLAWVAFIYVLVSREMEAGERISPLAILSRPGAVWQAVVGIGESGWYSIGGGQVKGAVLWVFWSIEALLIVGLVTLVSTSGIAGLVFCERCSRWCNSIKDRMRLAASEQDDVYRRLAEGDVRAMADLPVVASNVSPYVRVDLHRCPACRDTEVWQAFVVSHQHNDKGEIEQKDTAFTPLRHLSSQEAMELEGLAGRPPLEPPPAEA